MPKTPNWTAEAVVSLLEVYDPEHTVETVTEAMAALNRSRQSIVGKLVSEGVYIAPAKPERKPRDDGPTKGEILAAINEVVDVTGLEGATKPALVRIADRLGVEVTS
jgi:hypothetical protein|tara:strand:+ start:3790 stop:4110 length:321 start_codon:yes stop_codon:yes gene_type:complete